MTDSPDFNKLPLSFYKDDVLKVAPKLLGKLFVRKYRNRYLTGMIVEAEAYDGSFDQAAHTFTGKTPRNEIMFEAGGFLYVYFTYGMHYCCNVVTGKVGSGQACLIRAIEPVDGIESMHLNRFGKKELTSIPNLTNGPAKLCQALKIDKNLNGCNLQSDTVFLAAYKSIRKNDIITSSRIGIKKSVDLPWRFYVKDNPYVSKSKPSKPLK